MLNLSDQDTYALRSLVEYKAGLRPDALDKVPARADADEVAPLNDADSDEEDATVVAKDGSAATEAAADRAGSATAKGAGASIGPPQEADQLEIKYADIITTIRLELHRIYQYKDQDWNDWVKLFKEDNATEGLPYVFFNKRNGLFEEEQPAAYHEEYAEERTFESMVLQDGTEITTYVDETGQRMYMDWDNQCWRPLTEALAAGESEVSTEDPRLYEHEHPSAGSMFIYLVRLRRGGDGRGGAGTRGDKDRIWKWRKDGAPVVEVA